LPPATRTSGSYSGPLVRPLLLTSCRDRTPGPGVGHPDRGKSRCRSNWCATKNGSPVDSALKILGPTVCLRRTCESKPQCQLASSDLLSAHRALREFHEELEAGEG